MKKILLIAFIFLLGAGVAAAERDISNFDIQGFKLGMTMEQVREKAPGIEFKEARLPEGDLVGYYAFHDKLLFKFTTPEEGSELFFIVKYRVFKTKPDSYPIFMALTRKYGTPDYSGRDMWNIQACWGKCYGKHMRLHWSLKIAGIKSGFPMNITLMDLTKEDSDWMFFDLDSEAPLDQGIRR